MRRRLGIIARLFATSLACALLVFTLSLGAAWKRSMRTRDIIDRQMRLASPTSFEATQWSLMSDTGTVMIAYGGGAVTPIDPAAPAAIRHWDGKCPGPL